MPSSSTQRFENLPYTNLPGTGGSGFSQGEAYFRTATWTRTPGWPNVRPIPLNPYTMSLRKSNRGIKKILNPSNSPVPYTGTVWKYVGSEGGRYNSIPFVDDSQSKANSSARLRAMDQSANWAVNLAEIGQTYRSTLLVLARLSRAALGIYRADPKMVLSALAVTSRDARRVLRRPRGSDAAKLWLEYQYGWKPLYSDIYNSLSGATSRTNFGSFFRVTGNGRSEISGNRTQGMSGLERLEFYRISSLSKTQLDFSLSSSTIASLRNTGLSDPLSLAWELIPFSFVVDWFLPVGDFFRNLSATQGLSFVRGFTSTIKRTRVETSFRWPSGPANANKTLSGGVDIFEDVSFTRGILTSFPSVDPPRLRSPFSSTHIVNAIALFSANLKRL